MIVYYSEKHKLHTPKTVYEPRENILMPHPDSPDRGELLYEGIKALGPEIREPRLPGEEDLRKVHHGDYIDFLFEGANYFKGPRYYLPENFPIRRMHQPPEGYIGRLGYHCSDMETPFNGNALYAALLAAGSALDGAEALQKQEDTIIYALCRPPGHHAGPDFMGGYCYLNNAALGAELLSRYGRTALLDLDYHHGNGTQEIFYNTDAVFTLSIHASPGEEYPYYTGYHTETGKEEGMGFNTNFPLPRDCTKEKYLQALDIALDMITEMKQEYLVISLGFDTHKEDPMGGLCLEKGDWKELGRRCASLKLPTLVVQEGGYHGESLTQSVREFFTGMLI